MFEFKLEIEECEGTEEAFLIRGSSPKSDIETGSREAEANKARQ
jgi:hypothetical protein